VPTSVGFLRRLKAIQRPTPVVPCSFKAKRVEPKTSCVVRHAGLRPNGAWRDAVLASIIDE
jgi:hypothetical protein